MLCQTTGPLHYYNKKLQQAKLRSDAALVYFLMFQKSFKLKFFHRCYIFFHQSVSFITFRLYRIFEKIYDFFAQTNFHNQLLSHSTAVDVFHGRTINWFQVLSKLVSYLHENWRLFVDSLCQNFLILTNLLKLFLKYVRGSISNHSFYEM